MSFVDRKKQAHLWREELAPQHATPEAIVIKALAEHAAGFVVDFTVKSIAKAFAKYKLAPPSQPVAVEAPAAVVVKPKRVRKPAAKKS
jgi:hypothetical protein